GCLFGLIISLVHARLAVSETLLVFLAILVGLGAGRDWLADPRHLNLSYNFLLTCLFAGATFANIALEPQRLGELLSTIGVPIFAAFFVLAGYNLHLGELAALGWVGLAYVLLRVAGKYLGGLLGARWVGQPETIRPTIGLGLLCQAGVAIGLAEFLRDHWASPLAGQFYAVILGSVALFELIGPLALKWVAVNSGEVKAVTLLRRPGPARAEGLSPTRLVLDSALKLLRPGRGASPIGRGPLRVRDIMRTNVRFLRPGAGLDEVMHFVETSRFNHFPVVGDGNYLVGVIDFADIRQIIYDPLLTELVTAEDLAKPDSAVVASDESLERLADLFRLHNLGCMPVVDRPGSRRIVGLVEQRDLLRALHRGRQGAG
ncbi:MAG: CBS domain-containing protein, partial [Phycisphaerae bacterium]